MKLTYFFQKLGLVREHLLKYSGDPVIVRLAERRLARGAEEQKRKWQAPVALHMAERGLILDAMTAAGQTTRAGIGFGSQRRGPPPRTGSAEHRATVIEWWADRGVEEQMRCLGELAMQADWLKWEGVMAGDLEWNKVLYRLSPAELKFYLQAMQNVAPTPDYLRMTGYLKDPRCNLCHKYGCSLFHILSHCVVALEQGRLTWRHNELLRILHIFVGKFIRSLSKHPLPAVEHRAMKFVKAGQTCKPRNVRPPSVLQLATDWRISADLPHLSYQFPLHIAVTAQRPDIVIWSESLRTIILLELTVSYESGIADAHTRKQDKYAELVETCRSAQWKVLLRPVEVGVLGHIAVSMQKACSELGIWCRDLKEALSETALRCSYAIFVARKSLTFSTNWHMWQPRRTLSPEDESK